MKQLEKKITDDQIAYFRRKFSALLKQTQKYQKNRQKASSDKRYGNKR